MPLTLHPSQSYHSFGISPVLFLPHPLHRPSVTVPSHSEATARAREGGKEAPPPPNHGRDREPAGEREVNEPGGGDRAPAGGPVERRAGGAPPQPFREAQLLLREHPRLLLPPRPFLPRFARRLLLSTPRTYSSLTSLFLCTSDLRGCLDGERGCWPCGGEVS